MYVGQKATQNCTLDMLQKTRERFEKKLTKQ